MLRAWTKLFGKPSSWASKAGRGSRSVGGRFRVHLRLYDLEDRLAPAQLTVTSALDPDPLTPGTLRYAIHQANIDSSDRISDTIVFNPTQMGSNTITLAHPLPELYPRTGTTITIDGGGQITVSGNKMSPAFDVLSGGQTVLTGLTIKDGSGFSGGAIYSSGTLTVSNDTFSGNSATDHDAYGNGDGGAIYNTGTLTVTNSMFTGNSTLYGDGGAIYNSATLTVSNSTFSNNAVKSAGIIGGHGGALMTRGTATVTASTFNNNTTMGSGGAMENDGSLTVSSCTILANSAAFGGGIYNVGPMTLSNSTVAKNTATSGAGIFNDGPLAVSSSTITANTASANYSFDGGGGIYQYVGMVSLRNSIVAGNAVGQQATNPDISGVVAAGSHNLIGDGTGMSGLSNGDASGNRVGTAANPINPRLSGSGNPGNYGGPTQTYALLPGSPAIGAGGALTALNTAVLSTSSTTIPVSNAAAIASTPGQFLIQIDSEQMLVTNVDLRTNTLTVQRSYNHVQASHSAGASVYLATDQRGFDRVIPPDIGAYEYTLAPSIASIHPTSGPTKGGTIVTITGSNLGTASTVMVNFGPGNPVTIVSDDGSTLVVLSPHGGPGGDVVVVSTAAGTAFSPVPFTYVPVASILVLTGSPTSVVAGTASTLTVTARDGQGNIIIGEAGNIATGYTGTIHFRSTDTQAGLPANYTFTAADKGVHTFSAITLKTAGHATITATDTATASITVTSASITVNPAAVSRLVFGGLSPVIIAGTASRLTVTAQDVYSNTATSYTGTIHFRSSDAGAILPADYTFTAADKGVHTFSGITLKTAGHAGISASDTALTWLVGSSGSIMVNPAAASALVVGGIPKSIVAGKPVTFITVTAQDVYGNTVTDYQGTVHFSSTDPQAALPADSTLLQGFGTFTVTLHTTGRQTITVTDAADPGLSGKASTTVIATPVQDVFVIGLDNQVYAQRLDSNGRPTGGYALVASGQVKGLSASHDGGGRLELFVIGLDDQVYALKFDAFGNPSGSYFLTAMGQVKGLSAGTTANGNPELFAIGLDDQVYALKLDAGGNPTGTYFLTAVGQVKELSASNIANGSPELFVIGLDDQVYALKFDAAGNPSGSYFLTAVGQVKALSVGTTAAGSPELFVIGLDDQVYALPFDAAGNATGSYFLTAAGQVKTLSASSTAQGNPEVFVLGLDDQVWAELFDPSGNRTGGYGFIQAGQAKACTSSFSQGRTAPANAGN